MFSFIALELNLLVETNYIAYMYTLSGYHVAYVDALPLTSTPSYQSHFCSLGFFFSLFL